MNFCLLNERSPWFETYLLSEFNIVLGTSLEETQKKLDKALKRNLEAQKAKIEKTSNIGDDENQIQAEDMAEPSIESEQID